MCGGTVIVADRWFASSKICSACGHKRENLNLTEREWTCQECGVFHDRDVNAAKNLENLAVTHTVVACGEEDPGVSRKRCSKSSSMKQEPVQR